MDHGKELHPPADLRFCVYPVRVDVLQEFLYGEHDQLFHVLLDREVRHLYPIFPTLSVCLLGSRGRRDTSRRVDRRPLWAEIRNMVLYLRCGPFHNPAPLCGKPCRYGCSVSRYRSHHSLGLFRHIGLCHRPHAQSYRDDSRYLLWAVVWSWWAGQFVLRLAGRPDKYSFCLQSQHIAPVIRHYGHLPAKDEACMSRRLSVC